MAMMHYVGLDVHRDRSSIEVLDENGKRMSRKEVLGNWDKMIAEVEALPRPLAVCYEASCGYGYLHGRLSKVADRVEVAHPGNLRLIFKAKKKNDKVDASKLAKLLYLDAVPKVHVPSIDGRQWRGLIEFRRRLIDKRTAAKNQVRSVLRSNNLRPPKGTELWSKKGMAWLKDLKEDALPSMQLLQRDLLCDELEELAKKVGRVEAELAKIASNHPAVKTLMTIPGVGIRSEAAWQAVRRSPKVRAWFERITGDKPGRRKIALVAVARKLAVVMLAMMKSGQGWQETGEEDDAPAPDQK
jgi:transposase